MYLDHTRQKSKHKFCNVNKLIVLTFWWILTFLFQIPYMKAYRLLQMVIYSTWSNVKECRHACLHADFSGDFFFKLKLLSKMWRINLSNIHFALIFIKKGNKWTLFSELWHEYLFFLLDQPWLLQVLCLRKFKILNTFLCCSFQIDSKIFCKNKITISCVSVVKL